MAVDIEWIRRVCLSFPRATENMQWESLCFKIGGKLFAIAALEPRATWLSFKCSPETYAELIERLGVIPAPYLARAHWVALERRGAIPRGELEALLRQAYELILAKLPKRVHQNRSLAVAAQLRSRDRKGAVPD